MGVGKVKDVSEEEEFEGRTMMVSVGSSGDYPSLYGEQETSESIETEKGALTDICWLIPASGRPMSLGRNQSADISIPEYSVSADHGVLAWKRSKGLTIVDNAASNGIWIESENLRKLEPSEVYIFEGDERIMLGRFVFRFLYFESLVLLLSRQATQASKATAKKSKPTAKKSSGGWFKKLLGG